MKHSRNLFLVVMAYVASVSSLMAQDDPLKAPDNVAAAPAEAEVTASGLASIVLKKGEGTEKPTADSKVEVHYTGWQSSDGNMFDSSVKRGQTAEFPLNGVIKGWTEGLQLMVVGEKRRFWIPEDLAYGPAQEGSGRPGGQLVFDVELVSIKEAQKTTYEIVEAGEGESPSGDQFVEFHFAFYSPEGEVVQSSKDQSRPQSSAFSKLPPFFQGALSELKPGGKAVLQIPGEILGAPHEFVKTDLELVSVSAPLPLMVVPEGATKTPGGFDLIVVKEGEGKKPAEDDTVSFHYTLIGAGDRVLQSSKDNETPEKAPLKNLPPFLKEGLTELAAGGEAHVYSAGEPLRIPEELVKVQVELVEVKEPAPAPAVPEDVAAVPADAQKTESGLAYKVLEQGEGGDKPTAASTVTVHYTGWETNGEMFDSSVTRGETTSFPLGGVIAGWTEGLQLMSKGDKFRFWIPEDLAYGPKQEGSGRPGGLLVFDVELVDFK